MIELWTYFVESNCVLCGWIPKNSVTGFPVTVSFEASLPFVASITRSTNLKCSPRSHLFLKDAICSPCCFLFLFEFLFSHVTRILGEGSAVLSGNIKVLDELDIEGCGGVQWSAVHTVNRTGVCGECCAAQNPCLTMIEPGPSTSTRGPCQPKACGT